MSTAAHGALDSLPLLQGLEPEVRAIVEDAFTEEHYEFGAVIVRQGDDADAMYVLVEGSVRVLTVNERGDEVPLNVLEEGAVFGELALFDGGRRTATVRARTPTTVLRLGRDLFGALVRRHPAFRTEVERRRDLMGVNDLLALEAPFRSLPASVRFALAERLRQTPTTAGACVVKEGDPPGPLYVVREGRLRVKTDASHDQDVQFLRSGDVFGERSLLYGQPRAATVTAVSDGQLLELTPESYQALATAYPEIRELLDLRVAQHQTPLAGNIPLDFAERLLPPPATGRSRLPSSARHQLCVAGASCAASRRSVSSTRPTAAPRA